MWCSKRYFITLLNLLISSLTWLNTGCIQVANKSSNDTGKDNPSVVQQPHNTAPVKAITGNPVNSTKSKFVGNWVGWFEPDTTVREIYANEETAWNRSNKINLSIDSIKGDSVIGHSIVAGNDRPFRGTFVTANGIGFSLKEPGDNPYDGSFNFFIDTSLGRLVGTWEANKKLQIHKRRYQLTKRVFRYDSGASLIKDFHFIDWQKTKKLPNMPDREMNYDYSYFATTGDVYKYNASSKLLSKSDVENLKKADLFIIRNTIYARHGYSFKNQQLRAYFDRQPWYIPYKIDVKRDFTTTEKLNIELLLRYEKNASEYYDVFGRG